MNILNKKTFGMLLGLSVFGVFACQGMEKGPVELVELVPLVNIKILDY